MRGAGVLAAFLVFAACAPGDQQPAASFEEVQADSVALAAEVFDAAVFDTLTWDSDTSAVSRGRVVWAFSCRKCHGTDGLGDAGFVFKGDTLTPPSFAEPDWRFASDAAGLRLQVFTGNTQGMPHWGLACATSSGDIRDPCLPMRDIDAVTTYILEELRADVGAGS